MNIYISNLELGNDFLHMTCKAQITKENLDLFKVLKSVPSHALLEGCEGRVAKRNLTEYLFSTISHFL